MNYNRFSFIIIFKILLIIFNVILIVFLFSAENLWITSVLLSIVLIVQIFDLIRFTDSTNRKLQQFLQSIRYSDFSTSFFEETKGNSFVELNNEFNAVISEFRKTRTETQEQHNYLLTVVQHINIGIIAFGEDGKVDLMNNAVKRLLKINNLISIEDLVKINDDFPEKIKGLRAGDKTLIKIIIEDELLQLSISATQLKLKGKDLTLISLQNIHSELEENEIESWQKLIRVLTHEIMNSITPISSLVSTVNELLIEEKNGTPTIKQLDDDDVESVSDALAVISSRSKGLLHFVDIYRSLTRIPKPNFRYFHLEELFLRNIQLMRPKFKETKIDFNYSIEPKNIKVTADPDLLDQVLINLLVNAIDACKNIPEPKITLKGFLNRSSRMVIEISDNGVGISLDILDKVFMPFYTSKKHGSGIGLSLSRQIMHLHKGTITVKSKADEGTTFTLVF